MQILDGKAVAAKVLAEVKAGTTALTRKTGVTPTLAVILVGDFAPSQIYVRNKKRAADEAGIASRDFLYPTPVPGGVGPTTVAMLMKNVLLAAQRQLSPALLPGERGA